MVRRVTVLVPRPASGAHPYGFVPGFPVDHLPQEGVRGWDTHAGQTQPSVTTRAGTPRVGEISQSMEKPEPALPGSIPLPGRWAGQGWQAAGAAISPGCLGKGRQVTHSSWEGVQARLAGQSWPGAGSVLPAGAAG